MSEVWRAVVGFEGVYEVSDMGRVRSLDRIFEYSRIDQYSGRLLHIHRRHKGRILRPGASNVNSGHLSVVLGRKAGSKQVHALVLEAFVGPCPEGHECCHGDDVSSNNVLSNLRWGTRSDNLHDAVRNGKKAIGQDISRAKLRNADIPIIRSLFGVVSFSELGRRYGVNEATIRQIKDGRTWRHFP